MRIKSLFLAVLLAVSPVAPTIASGFPTVDLAALAQRIVQMQNVLKQYSEMINQTGLNVDQLNQMIDQYRQALTTYDHLLQQAKSLQFQIERQDWLRLLQTMNQFQLTNPLNPNSSDIRESSDTYTQDAVAQSSHMYGSIKKRDEYQQMLQQAFGSTYVSPEELQSYNQANMAVKQHSYNKFYQQEIVDTGNLVDRLDAEKNYLGDSSQLATTQFIMEQNQVLLRQQQQTNQLLQQQLELSNQFENQFFINQQKEKERRIQAALDNANTPIVIDESTQFRP